MRDRTVVLVGQPNSGKSAMFRVLSDINTAPIGATVEAAATFTNFNGNKVKLIDLPGVYSLNASHPAEEITLDFLLNQKVDLIINVVDSSLLTRSLELTVELSELGIPMVIALNMEDISNKQGISIDSAKLESTFNIPVVPTQAIHGKGVKKLSEKSANILNFGGGIPAEMKYTHHIEEHLESIAEKISTLENKKKLKTRFFAIKAIENPSLLTDDMKTLLGDFTKSIERDLFDHHKRDSYETISYERHHLAMKIAESITTFKASRKIPFIERFDNFLLHPIGGYFFLLLFFGLYFFSIFIIGDFIAGLIDPHVESLAGLFEPLKESHPFWWNTINGAYMGFAGAIGIVMPYFLPLVLLTAIFEETGYLSRIAFLIDGLMHRLGLHGKSVVPMILGFGCAIPALYATRILENKTERMLTGMLITFVPCSARISVIFALAAAFTGPFWAMVVFAYVIFIIALTGRVMSRFLKEPTGLVLEIPRLKLPSLKTSINKTTTKAVEFLKEAFVFLIAGGTVLGWFEYFEIGKYVDAFFAPILEYVLNLPHELGSTLVFGFLRKELILVMANQALGVESIAMLPMTISQIVVFVIFVTLYFPCLSTLIVQWKEFGAKTAIGATVLSVLIATVSAFLFKIFFNVFTI